MKIWKIVAISLFVVVLIGSAGCTFGANASSQPQIAVTRGDLSVKVNGTGKTMYANDIRLTFGASGQISKLGVKKGDKVAKGSLLAQLETTNMELALSQAKTAEAAAKAAITQAKVGNTQSQIAVTQAESTVTQAESARSQAEIALSTARMNLEKTLAVKEIKDDMTRAQWQIEIARAQLTTTNQTVVRDNQFWTAYIMQYQAELAKHQADLSKLLAKDAYAGIASYEIEGLKYDRMIVEDARMKQKQIESAELAVEAAKQNIDRAKENVQLTKQQSLLGQQNIDQAELALVQASKAVAAAQKQLDYASIIAPFDGYVADLGFKLNDFVMNTGLAGGPSIYLVDQSSLEIDTEIDEIDVAGVQVGQKASIKFDALAGNSFEGEVKSISLLPVSKIQSSGVVVFSAKVAFAGAIPVEVKSGMSASVDVTTLEKKDVILVPSKSIKRNSQGKAILSVVNGEKIEERQVVLGSTDGTNTEVISGLQDGDRIIKQIATSGAKSG